jgi:hypothetical protein
MWLDPAQPRELDDPCGAAEPKLHGTESSAPLVEQFDRLGCRGFRGLQPQSVAVVGSHGPDRAAEQNA